MFSAIVNDASIQSGDCVGVYGTIDYGSTENANASVNGYYVIAASQYEIHLILCNKVHAFGYDFSANGEMPIIATSSLGSGTISKVTSFSYYSFRRMVIKLVPLSAT